MLQSRTTGRVAMRLMAALFATFAFTAARAAETDSDVPPSSLTAMSRIEPMKMMQMMDKNKDSMVTREEFMNFQQSFFERMDKNKDGRLTPPEFTGREGESGIPAR